APSRASEPERHGAAQGGVLRGPRQRLQHARRARRDVQMGTRGKPPWQRRRRRRPARDALRARPRAADARQGARRPRGARRRGRSAAGHARARTRAARLPDRGPCPRAAARARVGDPGRARGARADPAPASMILYGRNPVHEALRGRRAASVGEVWASERAAREPWLAPRRPLIASAEELERRCGSPAHQGVCARAGAYPYAEAAELLAQKDSLILALDQVQDPQNLGAICRTAECAGAAGVVIGERRAAEVTPAVCKASAGAVEHLSLARVRNVADFLADARRAGFWC